MRRGIKWASKREEMETGGLAPDSGKWPLCAITEELIALNQSARHRPWQMGCSERYCYASR